MFLSDNSTRGNDYWSLGESTSFNWSGDFSLSDLVTEFSPMFHQGLKCWCWREFGMVESHSFIRTKCWKKNT